jgi:hypothetical protein
MDIAPGLLPSLVLAAALACGGARAAETVATAPADAPLNAPPSVAEQIDAYLKTSPALALPKEATDGVTSGDRLPRQAHGVVDVAVGSNGYRSAFVQSELPVGKTGTLSIGVGEIRFKGRGLGWSGYGRGAVDRGSLALGLSLGETALDAHDPRCRPSAEEGYDPRLDRRWDGRQAACAPPQAAPRPAQ